MKTSILIAIGLVVVGFAALGQERTGSEAVAAALRELSPRVVAESESEPLRAMLGLQLREQMEAANRESSAAWAKIETRADWESLRREKLNALRASLGEMPPRPAMPRSQVTGRLRGDGFQIQNVVYESRPGLIVTANLYVPDPPRQLMPGLLLSHAHHNPKEQGELQDMGMTWARAGCYVLVPDHLGHGERRQHPFESVADYVHSFQVGRQDYYFRYDTSLQLYLAGESLMGWMVHDLMTAVDLLLARPGIDAKRIAILGSVAGGGDPAAVTAALDERITCACPFNFGGPQPETRYPLPADAETSFNYAGGGSWESTRNLNRSAADGFLPWTIVGSTAPRHLIHAHEFAWDGERDPVWKRYQTIWELYDAADRLSVAHGHGTLTGQPPASSHCNNIGAVHRRQIHEAFSRWWNIRVRPEDEYSQRRATGELACLTAEARQQFRPRPLHELLSDLTKERLDGYRKASSGIAPPERRQLTREKWSRLLGDIEPREQFGVREGSPPVEQRGGVTVTREILQTEPGIEVPVVTLARSINGQANGGARRVFLAVADDGIAGILQRHTEEISKRLEGGWVVAIAEVRGTGVSPQANDRGPQGRLTSQSATSLMLGQPILAGQLRDLRAVWRHIQGRDKAMPRELHVLGDSGARPLDADASFSYPHRVDSRPPAIQPKGALLAMLLALFEDAVTSVDVRQGFVSYQSVLDGPFVQVPHDCIIPGVLREGDLPDLVAALAPREVRLGQLVDGCGRVVTAAAVKAAYDAAIRTYAAAGAENRLEFFDTSLRDNK